MHLYEFKEYVRYINYIVEGYAETINDFIAQSGDKAVVQATIDAYKTLVNKNQIQGNERNIDWWRKQGWNKFKSYVDGLSTKATKTQVKRKLAAGQSITLKETDNWLIVIPLDHDASCFHGRSTEWCTARPTGHFFDSYFLDKEVNLIYVLNKKTGDKWAIASHQKLKEIELFDKLDNSITSTTFKTQTGFDPYELIKLIPHGDPRIEKVRTDRRALLTLLKNKFLAWVDVGKFVRDAEIEELLIRSKHAATCEKYIELVYRAHGPQEYHEIIQLAAVRNNFTIIQYLKNPKIAVQLAAVKQNTWAIKYIIEEGITPSEAVQLAAVKQDGFAIGYIIEGGITPSEEVQLAVVNQDGTAIAFIIQGGITPSEDVQLAAVEQNGEAIAIIIQGEIKPSERVQLAAIKKNGWAIQFIIDGGITPSEDLQLAAVEQDGYAIQYIIKAGITPSEELQLAAVQQNGFVIEYIISGGIIPSDRVQLAAVQENGFVIEYIISGGITPSEEVQLAAVENSPGAIEYIKNPSEAVRRAAGR